MINICLMMIGSTLVLTNCKDLVKFQFVVILFEKRK
jgi:hypothetical protein